MKKTILFALAILIGIVSILSLGSLVMPREAHASSQVSINKRIVIKKKVVRKVVRRRVPVRRVIRRYHVVTPQNVVNNNNLSNNVTNIQEVHVN